MQAFKRIVTHTHTHAQSKIGGEWKDRVSQLKSNSDIEGKDFYYPAAVLGSEIPCCPGLLGNSFLHQRKSLSQSGLFKILLILCIEGGADERIF